MSWYFPHMDTHDDGEWEPRTRMVKQSLGEIGVGTMEADLVWESDPGEYGELCHLSRDQRESHAGTYYVSITDMEERDGSYVTVAVSRVGLRDLLTALTGEFNS